MALRIPTSRLITRHGVEAADAATTDHGAAVRGALVAPVRPAPDEPPGIGGMNAAIAAAIPLFSSDRFPELSAVLPGLLADVDTLVELVPEGRKVRGRLLHLTGWLLTQTRQFEAAGVALGRAMDDAYESRDVATTMSTTCWLLLRQGRVAEASSPAIRWADEMEPRMSRATPDDLSAWGWLPLRASAALHGTTGLRKRRMRSDWHGQRQWRQAVNGPRSAISFGHSAR